MNKSLISKQFMGKIIKFLIGYESPMFNDFILNLKINIH